MRAAFIWESLTYRKPSPVGSIVAVGGCCLLAGLAIGSLARSAAVRDSGAAATQVLAGPARATVLHHREPLRFPAVSSLQPFKSENSKAIETRAHPIEPLKLGPLPRTKFEPAEYPDTLRPSNGQNLSPRATGHARSSLTIQNGSDLDAAVKLATLSGAAIAFIYVRAGSEYKLDGINSRGYTLKFRQGLNWDRWLLGFRDSEVLRQFVDTINFDESTDSGGLTTFSENRVTLHTVLNGNARTRPLDPSEF